MNKPNKILILAMPRTGTTVMQADLAQRFQIPNLVEPDKQFQLIRHQDRVHIEDRYYQWLESIEHGIMKILGPMLLTMDFKQVLSSACFDHVVFVERDNLADCCISLYFAHECDRWHWAREQTPPADMFECPVTWVKNWISHLRAYQAACNLVCQQGISHSTLNYETYMDYHPQWICEKEIRRHHTTSTNPTDIEPKFIPYRTQCTNYQQVQDLIKDIAC